MKKNQKKLQSNINTKQVFGLGELLDLLYTLNTRKFVESVDLDVVLNLKTKNAKEVIRGSVQFPHQFGVEKIVYVLCEDKDVNLALSSGANKAGLEEIITEISTGKINFDVLLATPTVMNKIVGLAKILGPKGLMPNPKNGTVTENLSEAIKLFKLGKVNFKTNPPQQVVRLKVGNIKMDKSKLEDNILEALKVIYLETKKFNKNPLKKVTISLTMGPGLKLDTSDIINRI